MNRRKKNNLKEIKKKIKKKILKNKGSSNCQISGRNKRCMTNTKNKNNQMIKKKNKKGFNRKE